MKSKSNPFLASLRAATATFPVVLAVAGLFSHDARAANTWSGTTDQDWANATNWGGEFPTAGDLIIDTATANFPIYNELAAPFTGFNDIIIGNAVNGRLDMSAGTLATGAGNWLRMGQGGGLTGTFNLSGGTFTGRVHAARVGGVAGTAVIDVSGTGTLTSPGEIVISDGQNNAATAQGTLNVSGSGTVNSEGDLILAWAGNSNSFGELNIGSGATVNVASTAERWVIVNQWDTVQGRLNVNGGTLNLNAGSDLRLSVGNGVGTSAVDLNSGAITGTAGSQLDLMRSNVAGDNAVHLDGGVLTINQVITSEDNGTAVFNFNGGTLKAAASSANFVDLGGASQTAVVKSGGAVIDTNSFDSTIAQPLIDGTGGGGLTKQGTGMLTLLGANTYTGATSVVGGTLKLTGSLTSNITVASGATFASGTTLSSAGSSTGSLTFAAGSSLLVGTDGVETGAPTVVGVTFPGGGGKTSLLFDGPLTTAAVYDVINYGAGVVVNLANLAPTARGTLANDTVGKRITFTAGTVGTRTWKVAVAAGNWDINAATNWVEGDQKFLNGDTVVFPNPNAAATVSLVGNLLPAAPITVSNTTNAYTFTGSGSILGATSLTKSGSGALTIATANSYSNGTTLDAGTLNINNPTALGTGNVVINGGTINNTSGVAVVMSSNNPGTWNEDFTFTGTSNLDLGLGAVNVGGSGTDRSVTITAGVLAVGKITSSAHGLVKLGNGRLEIGSTGLGVGGGSFINGVLNLSAGTLQINRTVGDNGDMSSAGLIGGGTLINGASVERWFFSNPASGSFTFSGILANGGAGTLGFNKQGAGTQILAGLNTYTGRTTVGEGTLEIQNPVLADNAELHINGTAGTTTLNLTHNQIDQVGALVINGTALPNNVYDANSLETTGFITGTGKIRVGPAVASGYATWATANAGGGAPDGDFDNDGLDNGAEYFMGGTGSTFTANPPIVTTGGVRTVNWPNGGNVPSGSYGTQFVVETSTDLGTWTPVLATDPNLSNTAGGVTYTITGAGKSFVRLKVVPN